MEMIWFVIQMEQAFIEVPEGCYFELWTPHENPLNFRKFTSQVGGI